MLFCPWLTLLTKYWPTIDTVDPCPGDLDENDLTKDSSESEVNSLL